MSDEEQGFPDWLAEQHRHAQTRAVGAAQVAQAQYEQAVQHEDYVRQKADSPYLHARVAEERALAKFHSGRFTEARALAEMWAHVARALADAYLPPAPLLHASIEQPSQHPDAVGQKAIRDLIKRPCSG
ncbi:MULTISPECIES: hypothetical protein [unclassified Streptomyces]|uniref:hypothetical protein n=1 Tax=unclassified Streptomyces TaxID=2593676 RepID=UPI001CD6A098|nr:MULTISPECIES: hypothetical protein [unclassified Streptomyces]